MITLIVLAEYELQDKTAELNIAAARLAKDLPERPDGKTIAAAMAALIVLFGVSATVLGSRSNLRLPSVPPAAALLPRRASRRAAVRAALSDLRLRLLSTGRMSA